MKIFRACVTAVALMGVAAFASQGVALASTSTRSFSSKQRQLEHQLADYAALLGRFGSDVTGSTTLTPAHASTLEGLSGAADQDLSSLIAKVPTDKTFSELQGDEETSLSLRKIFAVLTPQVFDTIEADQEQHEYSTLFVDEETLSPIVSSLIGQSGYHDALKLYTSLVVSVDQAKVDMGGLIPKLLAQRSTNFPEDAGLLSTSGRLLENAQSSLATASRDEAVIGMTIGGFTGP